jgi:polyisoprenoid-binding protein YceI
MRSIKTCSFLFAFLAALTALGQDVSLHLDSASTKIEWTLGDVLHTVHGTFKLKRGDLSFNPSTGKAGGQLVVDATSGESGSGTRDGRMHRNVLESGKFPEITFLPDRVIGKVNVQGDSDVQLHGTFTIHGASHEVTIPAKTHIEQQKMTATIGFPVPYVKWGMKDPSNFLLKVKDTVEIDIHATGQLAGAATSAAR